MEKHIVKVTTIHHINHDVLRIITEKPEGYNFMPGQATEVSVNREEWKKETRPFTFTCLPEEDYLEFCIKTYPEHRGVTNELLKLKEGDELILHDIFGTINYKDEGIFVAGGAGVTPFISILRYLNAKNKIGNNKLIFANKTRKDIFMEDEFRNMLGDNFINILSEERTEEHAHGFVTEEFLKKYMDDTVKNIYICGPPPMLDMLEDILSGLKFDKGSIVKEEF
jgi:ferredoxin-NADP reductase